MDPLVFDDIGSADPIVYEEYKVFIRGKEITSEKSLGIARGYLNTIDYADVTPVLDAITEERWIDGRKKYLSQPHKWEAL